MRVRTAPPRMRPKVTREALRKLNAAAGYLFHNYGDTATSAMDVLFEASVRVVKSEDCNVEERAAR